jgi:1-acyl-sn-glycerol-3-phosphate acyltransferase
MLFTILYYTYFLLATPVLFTGAALVTLFTFPFDKNRKVLHHYSYFWTLHYYRVSPWWKIQLRGQENVTPNKPYVIMSNHQSMLDICLLYKVPTEFKWVSKKEVVRLPFFGWALWLHHDVIISRGDRAGLVKMLRLSREYLSRGVSIIMFPEGTRTKDGRMHDFKEGGFLLAKTAETAILPVVIDGNYNLTHGRTLKRKQQLTVEILPEITAEEVAALSSKELLRKTHALMLETHRKMAPDKYSGEAEPPAQLKNS